MPLILGSDFILRRKAISFFVVCYLSFFDCYFYSISEALADEFANLFRHTDNIVRSTHFDNLASVWNSIECGIDQKSSFSIEFSDVVWYNDICCIYVFVLQYFCFKLQGHNLFLQLPAVFGVIDHLFCHASIDTDILTGDEASLVAAEV